LMFHSKYGLEERLWHQSGGQTACWHKTSHWSGGVPPIWCQDVVGEYTWFYFEKRWNWRITVLPLQSE
jgi:hypothetical protein